MRLRAATHADGPMLLEWRNDDGTRQGSFTRARVSEAQHRHWLADYLRFQGCRMWIAENDAGEPLGVVRAGVNEDTAELGIVVAPEHRNEGHAVPMLQQAVRVMLTEGFASRFMARVRPENTVSQMAFRNAGFKQVSSAYDAWVTFEWE